MDGNLDYLLASVHGGQEVSGSIIMMCLPDRVWLVLELIDTRLGIDGLTHYLQRSLGQKP